MYQSSVLPEIDFIFGGGILTIFAHGQTGSGKTHTIDELQNFLSVDLFRAAELHHGDTGKNVGLTISYFEIVGSKIIDLLNNRKSLKVMESKKNKIEIPGLKEVAAQDMSELSDLIQYGKSQRKTESTVSNSTSSRSHAV